eukprot:CAMPEP_0174305428 /NCGR_PEP_ID=MMETSP0809-20121228/61407_1 /TAXON_ID=73025 ORGANISM="Eutreptiella gymnastica-like, Strain CCMP1594" /NCGR_SAMPLE_ID=MMETSP0809 /ASSEMBLY_ACC=CAM_ASM_000658 /LENGTH=157 /DNA_ID=CAMNT_0015411905 /DNA_START=110 /DNA_END=585 /DNA_ORIENTATION=+
MAARCVRDAGVRTATDAPVPFAAPVVLDGPLCTEDGHVEAGLEGPFSGAFDGQRWGAAAQPSGIAGVTAGGSPAPVPSSGVPQSFAEMYIAEPYIPVLLRAALPWSLSHVPFGAPASDSGRGAARCATRVAGAPDTPAQVCPIHEFVPATGYVHEAR